jgi:hypothetical protein
MVLVLGRDGHNDAPGSSGRRSRRRGIRLLVLLLGRRGVLRVLRLLVLLRGRRGGRCAIPSSTSTWCCSCVLLRGGEFRCETHGAVEGLCGCTMYNVRMYDGDGGIVVMLIAV